jgi:hypothetical protein
MNAFADTNWLEALCFRPPEDASAEAKARRSVVERHMRKTSSPLIISHLVAGG